MFERRLQSGESVNRSWLCFSPSKGSVYCYVCKLRTTSRSLLAHGEFSDWKHARTRLANHEKLGEHHQSVLLLARRSLEIGQVDHELTQQAKQIEQYSQSVLKRLIKVLTFLCQRGLALSGDNQVIGSVRNGNYLGILKLLSEYNDFLKQHLQQHARYGSGHTNYLSSTKCEEQWRTHEGVSGVKPPPQMKISKEMKTSYLGTNRVFSYRDRRNFSYVFLRYPTCL